MVLSCFMTEKKGSAGIKREDRFTWITQSTWNTRLVIGFVLLRLYPPSLLSLFLRIAIGKRNVPQRAARERNANDKPSGSL